MNFRKKRVVYLPLDSPPGVMQKILQRKASKVKNTGAGILYLLEDKIVVFQAVGAPAAVLSLERLIASGTKEILVLGTCGSLNQKYRIASAASIAIAFADEGTSKHYFPQKKNFSASPSLKNNLEATLKASGLPFSECSVVSTDAPFRETKLWIKKMQTKKIDLVDMEASSVFALAEFYGIRAAALMIVSDELFSGIWKQGFASPEVDKKIKDYFLLFI